MKVAVNRKTNGFYFSSPATFLNQTQFDIFVLRQPSACFHLVAALKTNQTTGNDDDRIGITIVPATCFLPITATSHGYF